jgi:hypothetical protein
MESTASKSKQLAQSASAIVAAILGFGIGAKWGVGVQAFSVFIIVIGAIIHTYGMYVMQMKSGSQKTNTAAKLLWVSAWVCLVALVVLFIYML